MTEEKRRWKEKTPAEIELIKAKAQKRREKNLRIITEHIDSVCIIPAEKPASARYVLVDMIFTVDKMVSLLKRQVGFNLAFDIARNLLESFNDFIDHLWANVIKTSPHLYSFNKRNWRDLNDTIDIKLKLVEGRNFVNVIDPRSEEIGQIAIAVKILENHILYVRTTGSFDKMEETINIYRNTIEEFDAFLIGLAETIKFDYRSSLKKHEFGEDGQKTDRTAWPFLSEETTEATNSTEQAEKEEKADPKKRRKMGLPGTT